MTDATDAVALADPGGQALRLLKAPTGIVGFDEVTFGGLPRGRATLVTGGAGSGKTVFGLEFLVRGARDFGEPGVLLSFEESAAELSTNVASMGFDLPELERQDMLVIDAFRIDAATLITTGVFDLDGLFIRLEMAVDSIGAKRVVLDTIEVLFTALGNEAIIRGELTRLFRWLKDRDLTVVITGESGLTGGLTRFGIEEYVSDCVIVLDHRIRDELATRRMRIAKYRGSVHGTNEYPFLITNHGLVVLPLTSMGSTRTATTERVATGVDRLDHMLDGGLHRDSIVLISGDAGTGKTILAASMADAACGRGERVLFISYAESPAQLVRNMGSIGLNLQHWVDSGLLKLWSVGPTSYGLEEHLVELHRLLDETHPSLTVLDATAGLSRVGMSGAVRATVARQIDMLKARGVTAVLTALTEDGQGLATAIEVTSLVDTWLMVRNTERNGERNRLLYVVKSRGTAHSNQVREFVLTSRGAELLDVYVGPQGVLTGSARMAQLADERAAANARRARGDRRRSDLARRTAQVEQQITALREEITADRFDLDQHVEQDIATDVGRDADRAAMAAHRWADPTAQSGERPQS